jgi:4,5-DOPA dioxygenase extradiol
MPTVSAAERPETIHDFYGFPDELYRIRYPALGAPRVAGRVAELLKGAGLACGIDGERGLDHGAWVPVSLMFPNADIPVLQLSIQSHLDPAQHLAVGRALAPLKDEGILVIGSGGAVHPLGYADLREGAPTEKWALDFDQWLAKAVTGGDTGSLVRYREIAPYPERAHPYPDHYMPILAAMGAAGEGAKGKILHDSWTLGDMGMAAFEFRN